MNTLIISLLLVSSPPAACSIQVVVPGQIVRGSGTLVTPTLVLSAAHVFKRRGPTTVWFGQQRRSATVLLANADFDVALLRLASAPTGIAPIPIASTPPPIGAKVEVWGRDRSFDGTVVSAMGSPGIDFGVQGRYGQVTVPGDSGGAVIFNNTLVGVHWGYRTQNQHALVHAARCDVIKEWLVRTHR